MIHHNDNTKGNIFTKIKDFAKANPKASGEQLLRTLITERITDGFAQQEEQQRRNLSLQALEARIAEEAPLSICHKTTDPNKDSNIISAVSRLFKMSSASRPTDPYSATADAQLLNEMAKHRLSDDMKSLKNSGGPSPEDNM